MAKTAEIQERALGPWPSGVNNVADQHSAVFQPSDERRAALREAINLDLDSDGWPRRRVGRTKLEALADGHSLFAASDALYFVDAGRLHRKTAPQAVSEVIAEAAGSAAVSFAEAAGQLWWISHEAKGRIEQGAAKPWGLATPALALTAIAGAMEPATYLVAATVEAGGIESGAALPSRIELGDGQAIAVSLVGLDPSAETVNLYCSEPNGSELYWVDTYPAGTSFTITRTKVSADILDTFNLYPPPLGQRCAAFNGRMLVAAGAALYWSQPLAFHHFALAEDAQLFDSEIVLLEPLSSGFYVATQTATYWVAGDDPHSWRPVVVDRARVSGGSALRISGHKLPALEYGGEVLVWATSDGFVAAPPDGQLRRLTDGRVAMNAHAQASLAFREEAGIRQVLLAKQQRVGMARLGASDRVTIRVTRAGQEI